MYCSKCGAFNNRENKFCINCGDKLPKAISKEIPLDSRTTLRPGHDSKSIESETAKDKIPLENVTLKKLLQKEKKGVPFFDIGIYINDKYQLKKFLGRGGMGEVYKAYDTKTNKYVAIKMMLPSLMDKDEILKRFFNEAKVAKQIIHPNVVRAIESGEYEGINFIVMDFVEGISLRKWIDDKSRDMDTEQIITLLVQLCDGLKFAHEYTVHRDIKPENIIITDDGVIKIMDFGIAKTLSVTQLTETHTAMGTAYYMAPEQTRTPGVVDERADLFSVGVIFYEMLTGKVPIGNFKIPTSTRKLITASIGEVLRKALEPDPEDRFKNAEDMYDALKKAKDEIKKIKIERKVFEERQNQGDQPSFLEKKEKSRLFSKRFAIITSAIGCFCLVLFLGYMISRNKAKDIKYYDKPEIDITQVSIDTTEDIISATDIIDSVTNLPKEVDTKASDIEMVLVPAGAFVMGTPGGKGDDDETPLHKVWLNNFYIGKYEVTNRQYKMFVDETGYDPPINIFGQDSEYSLWNYDNVSDDLLDYPVINISWYDAMAFCKWLCKKENVPEGVYRLPTEAEWEKAARGPGEYTYPWGNSSPNNKVLNFDKRWEGAFTLKAVGSYQPNEYGVYDMAGNVWEWCMDKYLPAFYNISEYENPVSDVGEQRVLRGGSWSSYDYLVRSANRYSNDPDVRYFYNGFRVVRRV